MNLRFQNARPIFSRVFFKWQFESTKFFPFSFLKHSFLFPTVNTKSEKESFFCFLVKHWKNSFNTIIQLINPNYASKIAKQIETIQQKLLQVFLPPDSYGPQPWGKNAAKFRFFYFCTIYHIYTWVDLICLACQTFPKSLWWRAWAFWA